MRRYCCADEASKSDAWANRQILRRYSRSGRGRRDLRGPIGKSRNARWNRASAALFGFSDAEALAQSLDLIVPDHLRAAHWRGFDDAMANGVLKLQGRPTLTRALHKSGRKLYVEMTFALVAVDGVTQGAVAVARDVTERVSEQRARQTKAPASG